MFYKVKEVKPLKDYILEITFFNEKIKYYDVSNLFEKWKIFNELRENKELFNKVKVDKGGYGISWSDEIDLSCDELWENSYSK